MTYDYDKLAGLRLATADHRRADPDRARRQGLLARAVA